MAQRISKHAGELPAIGIASAVTALCVLGVAWVQLGSGLKWAGWQLAVGWPNHLFNEAIRSGSVRQPSNTYSSLAFVFIGVFILALPLAEQRAGTTRLAVSANRTLHALFGASLVVTGLGSAFYHASLTFPGQVTDVAGMYLLSTFVVLYALSDEGRRSFRWFITSYVACNLVLLAVLIGVPGLRRWLFALILLIGLVLEYLRGRKTANLRTSLLLASAGTLLVAFAIWNMDNAHLIFSPTSLIQGHAIWHVLGAVSAALLYAYYEGEAEARVPWRNRHEGGDGQWAG